MHGYQVAPQLYGDDKTYIYSAWTVRKDIVTFFYLDFSLLK